MIKNVYFSVAKAQVADPNGKFSIVLLGTDALEMLFGTGDVSLTGIVLRTSWRQRLEIASADLKEFDIPVPFDEMVDEGVDILCPITLQQTVLIGGLSLGEREEDEDETDLLPAVIIKSESTANPLAYTGSPERTDFEPDLEDLAGSHPLLASQDEERHEAFVAIDQSGKLQHKATVLRILSNPLAAKGSKDRLKRVRGFLAYETTHRSGLGLGASEFAPTLSSITDSDKESESPSLFLEDPALVLLACNHQIFLGVILVQEITYRTIPKSSLSYDLLHEPATQIRGQIMRIINTSASLSDSRAETHTDVLHASRTDWEWTVMSS
ncbi:hypothetical protein NLI96_g11492 [Meripilus lineatus]|uniref:Uncharacterized protein n=1 Tax=Meripilus lineatus TaxID=2056292 RepID=A0AAD5YDC1_9APHY|nr:hypothetical protein NLI96_g11492 [Physisporinus lineatus]